MGSYHYIGCFFDRERLYRRMERQGWVVLPRKIDCPHVTARYKPEQVDEALFGAEITVRVVGYGNNGRNEGVAVEVTSDRPEVQALLDKIAVPHITLTLAEGAAAVDTGALIFHPVEPFVLKGVFGGYRTGGTVVCAAP